MFLAEFIHFQEINLQHIFSFEVFSNIQIHQSTHFDSIQSKLTHFVHYTVPTKVWLIDKQQNMIQHHTLFFFNHNCHWLKYDKVQGVFYSPTISTSTLSFFIFFHNRWRITDLQIQKCVIGTVPQPSCCCCCCCNKISCKHGVVYCRCCSWLQSTVIILSRKIGSLTALQGELIGHDNIINTKRNHTPQATQIDVCWQILHSGM